jgi:surface antigen
MKATTLLRRLRLLAFATIVAALALAGLAAPAQAADDYKPTGEFVKGSCADFVASRLKATGVNRNGVLFGNSAWGRTFGDAANWENTATQFGYAVDGKPTVGSIAHWRSNETKQWQTPTSYGSTYGGNQGHVAVVVGVSGDFVDLEEYNHDGDHSYHLTRGVQAPRYIHFHHALGSSPAPGRLAVTVKQFTPGAGRIYYVRDGQKGAGWIRTDVTIDAAGNASLTRSVPAGSYSLLVGDSAHHATHVVAAVRVS